VRALADRYLDELRAVIAGDGDVPSGAPVPSDFPLARLDQAQLSRLLDTL